MSIPLKPDKATKVYVIINYRRVGFHEGDWQEIIGIFSSHEKANNHIQDSLGVVDVDGWSIDEYEVDNP